MRAGGDQRSSRPRPTRGPQPAPRLVPSRPGPARSRGHSPGAPRPCPARRARAGRRRPPGLQEAPRPPAPPAAPSAQRPRQAIPGSERGRPRAAAGAAGTCSSPAPATAVAIAAPAPRASLCPGPAAPAARPRLCLRRARPRRSGCVPAAVLGPSRSFSGPGPLCLSLWTCLSQSLALRPFLGPHLFIPVLCLSLCPVPSLSLPLPPLCVCLCFSFCLCLSWLPVNVSDYLCSKDSNCDMAGADSPCTGAW